MKNQVEPMELAIKALAAEPKQDLDQLDNSVKKTDDGRLEILKRQVDTKAQIQGQNTNAQQLVSFNTLISCATTGEKALMYVGWCFAFITGIGLPLFAQFL